MLARSDPDRSAQLLGLAQADIDERWHYYEQLAGVEQMVHDPAEIVVEMDETSTEAANEEGDDDA